jgi:hypothetical protein
MHGGATSKTNQSKTYLSAASLLIIGIVFASLLSFAALLTALSGHALLAALLAALAVIVVIIIAALLSALAIVIIIISFWFRVWCMSWLSHW